MTDDSQSPDGRESLTDATEEISEKLEAGAGKAIDEFDQRLVNFLSWLLETETKARIYTYLRREPSSTSEEIAEGTGLYPSTVREALAEMTDDEVLKRFKRKSDGAGNNPYAYEAMAPSELVAKRTDQVQEQLNALVNLDHYLVGSDEPPAEPVTITVTEGEDDSAESDGSVESAGAEETAEAAEDEPEEDDVAGSTAGEGPDK